MKVLEDLANNLFVYIHTNDHTPSHVHVFRGRMNDTNEDEVLINLGNDQQRPEFRELRGMSNKDAVLALKLVVAHQDELLKRWREIHGQQEKLGSGTDRGKPPKGNRKSQKSSRNR